MDDAEKTEEFVQQITQQQNRLYAYIFSLLGDHSRAADVLQETNLVLWRKVEEFQPERPFLPWATAIARFQVLANLRDRKRDRLLLDEELVTAFSADSETNVGDVEDIRRFLRECIETLSPGNRDLIHQKYYLGGSIAAIADAVGRSVSSVKVALLRSRRHLADCIQLRLVAEAES